MNALNSGLDDFGGEVLSGNVTANSDGLASSSLDFVDNGLSFLCAASSTGSANASSLR